MRILHVLDHSLPLHSGYAFRTRAILQEQKALGWITEHITSPKHGLNGGQASGEETSANLHFFRTTPRGGNPAAVIYALERRLEEVIRLVRPDILHAHSPALDGVAALAAGRRLGIPVVYEMRASWEDAAVSHGTLEDGDLKYRMMRALETGVLRFASEVTCICEGLRQDIMSRGVPAERITIIPNAVNATNFTPIEARDEELVQSLGLEKRRVVGYIGSFYQYEGLHLLLAAVPQLVKAVANLHVLLIGGGKVEDELKAQVKALAIEDRVTFTGRIPHDEIARYYSVIDVLAYPRVPMRITDLVTPLKPLEAMAQKRLFAASDVGGHRELIRDGETGALFSAGDVDGLAKRVVDLLTDEALGKRLREGGRKFVEEERTWARSISNYETVYQRLLR